MADRILDQAGGIPLVIATLGAIIGKAEEDTNDLEVWKCASENLTQCLKSEKPSQVITGITYSRSYWSAMKQCIDGLSQQERSLFLLIGMCKGPSVPQYILHYFCSVLFSKEDCNVIQFSHWKRELKDRQLVFEKQKKWLSIHSLNKRLVVKYMTDTLGSILHSLVNIGSHSLLYPEPSRHTTLLIVVVACFYLDAEFCEPLAVQNRLTFNTLDEAMRETIDPITTLLLHEAISSRNWTEGLQICAREVFIRFR